MVSQAAGTSFCLTPTHAQVSEHFNSLNFTELVSDLSWLQILVDTSWIPCVRREGEAAIGHHCIVLRDKREVA